MKLSHPLAIKMVALLASWALRLWLSTLDIRFAFEGGVGGWGRRRRVVYVFWHEMLLFPAYTHAWQRVAILISRHRDGELIAQVVRMLRGQAVRGSTKRGGAAALRGLMRKGRLGHLAITPDGPRGPRRVVQPGAVYLASKMQMAIVPVGFAFDRCWQAGSWDKMALPRPGQRARGVVGAPIEVPDALSRGQLEQYRQRVQQELDRVQQRAERLAAGEDRGAKLYSLGQVREAYAME